MLKQTARLSMALLLVFLATSLSHSAIKKYPYVQNPEQGAMTLMWETDTESQDTLEWGTTESFGNSQQDDSPTMYHEHRLSGLDTETTYYYRVVHNGTPTDTKTFSTAPDLCSPFKFIVTGDTRSGDTSHALTTEKMIAANADFVINTGDIIDAEDEMWKNENFWQIHFDIEKDLMASVPLFPVWGNHDVGCEPIWERIFDINQSSPDGYPPSNSEYYYSFKYGNSLFVQVDVMREYTVGSDEYEWLQSTLQTGHDDPEVMHIFVSYHLPGLSVGDHGNNDTIINHLHPLFFQYGVQATFTGHDHTFQHLQTNNVNFVVSGGGGASLYNQVSYSSHLLRFDKRFHHCAFEVSGADVSFECVDSYTGQIFYSYSWSDSMDKNPCGDIDDDDDDSTDDDDDDASDDDDATNTDDDDNQSESSDDDDDESGSCCG